MTLDPKKPSEDTGTVHSDPLPVTEPQGEEVMDDEEEDEDWDENDEDMVEEEDED